MKIKIILGALVIVVGVAITFWPQKNSPSLTVSPAQSESQSPQSPPTPAKIQPVDQQAHLSRVPNATSPEQKFANMGVLDRSAILDEIGMRDLPLIFQAMLDAKRLEQDSRKQMLLKTTFANALSQKTPSPEFLEQLYGFVTTSANSAFERQLVIGALESAATKETVDLLLRVANTAQEQKIRESAGSLAGVGAGGRGGPELSPALERVWRESGNPKLLMSTAASMARIGAPSGIELLLSAALATDDRDKARQVAAQAALQQVYQRDAVPPLAARLANQPPTSEVVKLVAPILARITGPAAQEALVGWLRGRPENAAPLVHELIRQRIPGDPFESAWATALDPAVPFRNEENRKAIREALDAYRAGRTSR